MLSVLIDNSAVFQALGTNIRFQDGVASRALPFKIFTGNNLVYYHHAAASDRDARLIISVAASPRDVAEATMLQRADGLQISP